MMIGLLKIVCAPSVALWLVAVSIVLSTTSCGNQALSQVESAGKMAPLQGIPVPVVSLFPLSDVRLLPGVFQKAQNTDRAYLLKLDPDRLLSYVRKNAGLTPKGKPYGGWDSSGSSTIGHYLSACSQMYAATGDPLLKKRVDYVVAELAAAQKAAGDNGIYAFEWDRTHFFHNLREGKVEAVGVNGWYLTHKIFAGLRDAALQAGNAQAKEVLIKMTDWAIKVTSTLTPDQWQTMLDAEHGGPHEIFADVYAMTGDKKYLDFAEKFRHEKVFAPLAKGDDSVLTGLHANAQVPKFIGYERIYELTGDAPWHAAAMHFWDSVAQERSWANGGNSQWEHFFPKDGFAKSLKAISGPETCNTYNMLKLTEQLYTLKPSTSYFDYAERALYNHILPSQSPEGGFAYYTPQRPGHYRVFSRDYDSFWCCVGTGMENHARYGEMIFAHNKDALYVNLFIPAEVVWKEKRITVRQDTRFPEVPASTLKMTMKSPQTFTLAVRQPKWVTAGDFALTVNGAAVPAKPDTNGYATVRRAWKNGDRIGISLPMTLSAEPLPGSTDHVAFRYGPVLLVGKLGTEGLAKGDFFAGGTDNGGQAGWSQLAKNALPLYDAPVILATLDTALSHVKPITGQPLHFALTGTNSTKPVRLAPFYEVYFERYATYWQFADTPTGRALRTKATRAALERDTLAARTLDDVKIGIEASEKSHNYQGVQSSTGGADSPTAMRWRDAKGWFRYDMAVSPDAPNAVRARYWGADTGRVFEILADDVVIGKESLTGAAGPDYVFVTYPIPPSLTRGKAKVSVMFRAVPGSVAGGVTDVRTVRPVAGGNQPRSVR